MAFNTWSAVIAMTVILPSVDVQMAMPMYSLMSHYQLPSPIEMVPFPPPPPPPPMPMQYPMPPPPMPIPYAIPPPMAFPVQIVMQKMTTTEPPPDPPKIPNKPACPPCICFPCIPSFYAYCSPCHLKCRCREGDIVPKPLPPYPPQPLPDMSGYNVAPMVPISPPVVYMPKPPLPLVPEEDRNVRSRSQISSLRNGEPQETRRSKHDNNVYIYENDQNEVASPMLSYINQNGDITFNKIITNLEAAELISNGELTRAEEEEISNDGAATEDKLENVADIIQNFNLLPYNVSTEEKGVLSKYTRAGNKPQEYELVNEKGKSPKIVITM